MIQRLLIYLCVAWLTTSLAAQAANPGDEVVVVYNTRVAESKDVAQHYAALRHVPADQVWGLDMPDSEETSRRDFDEKLQKPIAKKLESTGLFHFEKQPDPSTNAEPGATIKVVTSAKIRYLVLCYGVPLRIVEDHDLKEEGEDKVRPELRRNEAAVDSELACLPRVYQKMLLAGPASNPAFAATNAARLNPTNNILLVARLDGPTASIARTLVDKAIQAELDGLWGRAYFDLRGLATNDPARMGDDWIRSASEVSREMGFETVVDNNYGSFPPAFPLSQVALYAGWYNENVSGPFARPTVEFMPGAVAYHLHSFSAASLRTVTRQWCGPLLARGATATMGCVDEPYLGGTPNIGLFFARFIYSGFSFGEAAYACQNFLSWQTTVIGDPLYRPFARPLGELHESLNARKSKLVEWSWLRLLDVQLAHGAPREKMLKALEDLPFSTVSAVLQEKLADLYLQEKKPAQSIIALQSALKLAPTPQQAIRLTLNLVEQLRDAGRNAEAYALLQKFPDRFPSYPDELDIYRKLRDLAQKLNKPADLLKFQEKIAQLSIPAKPR